MHCPDAFDLAEAASCQFRGQLDGFAGGTWRDDAAVGSGLRREHPRALSAFLFCGPWPPAGGPYSIRYGFFLSRANS